MSYASFPIQQFYQALMSITGLQPKLQGIIVQFKKKNMSMIYDTIVHIHQILISKLEPPLMKFNALMATKIFFDLCQYPAIVLIQIYILPIIFQIAVFKTTKKSDQGVSLYFIQRGSQATKQIKRLGFNYVILAIQFIFASSQIKASRVLENQQLQEQSNYKKISKALVMRGIKKISKFTYYEQNYFQQTKKIYLQKLKIYLPQTFVDFFSQIMRKQLSGQAKAQLDSKRLIMFGDVYITSPLISLIEQQLNNIDGSFQSKKRYLLLLNQLIRFGYIQAVILLNSCDFLFSITNQISKVDGDKDLDQGRYIYPLIDDNPKTKKAFYLQFLKCIETWSYAVPFNQNNDQADARRIVDFLKYQKKFKFPENANMHKFKSQMELYLKQNSERNEKVVGLIQQRSNQQSSKYKISSLASLKGQSKVSSKKGKGVKINDYKNIQDLIIEAMQVLQVIGYSQKSYPKDIKMLLEFKDNWKQYLDQISAQSRNEQNFQILISQGEIVIQQIKSLQQINKQLLNKKIDFVIAQQRIDNILNNINNEKNEAMQKSSISAVSKFTVQTVNGKRDIASKISEVVKRQKDLSNSKYSQYSASVSAKSNNQKKKQNQFIKDKQNQQTKKTQEAFQKNKKTQQNHMKVIPQDQINLNQYGIGSLRKKIIKQSFISPRESQSQVQLKKKVNTKTPIKYYQDNTSLMDQEINYSKAQFARIQKQSNFQSGQSIFNKKKAFKKSILKKQPTETQKQMKLSSINNKKKSQRNSASQSSQKQSLRNKKLNIISFNEGNSGFLIGSQNQYGLNQKQKVNNKVQQLILESKILENKQNTQHQQEMKNSKNLRISKNLQKISKMQKLYTSKQISKISQKDKQYISFTNIELSESKDEKNKIPHKQIIFQKDEQGSKINTQINERDVIQQRQQQNPMLESYYNTKQLHESNSNSLNFKQVINTNKQTFHRKQHIKFQQKDFHKLEHSKGKSSKSHKEATIMATLTQRNAKKSIEMYRLQREKNKIIEGLNLKIRKLQNQQRSFHHKFLRKDNSMKSNSFKQYSQRDRLKFKADAQSNQCSFSNSSREINMSKQIMKNFIQTNEFDYQNSQIKDINSQQYQDFLRIVNDYNIKRNLLKSKCLLVSTQQLQIGCMSIRKDSFVNFTLFITPKKYSLEDLQISFQNDHNISISALPDRLYKLRIKKQETINIKILIQNIPYKIPKLILTYKVEQIKSTTFKEQILIPCGFNKMCSYEQIGAQKFKQMFTFKDIYIINDFKMSNKIFKQEKMKQMFPYLLLLKKSEGKKEYGCEVSYNGNLFLLKFLTNERLYCRIQAKNMTGQNKNVKFLQFLACTFKKILQSNKL